MNHTKILRSYTIIPPELYINRSADTQLQRTIIDMGRPAYILVARQMGKTNLLLHAKRTLSNHSDKFVYIDISNTFPDIRSFFQNTINTFFDSCPGINIEIFQLIEEKRKKIPSLPPHKEHENELRLIIQAIGGKLVICLDEIDALTRTNYSDEVFSFIRSIYFAGRANFTEFHRLTYVLSGVAEPSELIKDKAVSPFNIGEKIYLDDFSKQEHDNFIKKSKLNISSETSDAIFEWTNGNPRLTFDICSNVEDYMNSQSVVTKETVVEIIHKKYLTNFDLAPIDNIRELVKSDKAVRKAVYNIQNKLDYLPDAIKTKLYLYGIIGSNFNEKPIIKNKIIKESLSIDWINSIDKQTQDSLSYGLEKVNTGEFKEAIINLVDFIKNSDCTEQQLETCNYNIGYSYYKLDALYEGIEYFSKEYKQELYKYNALSFLGACKIVLGEITEGIKILEKVIEQETNEFAYHNALLNLATHLQIEEYGRSLELYEILFNSTFKATKTKESELNKLRVISLYFQSKIYRHKNEIAKELSKIIEAQKYASMLDSLYLMYCEYNLNETKDEIILEKIANLIVDNNLRFDTEFDYEISFKESHLFLYISLLFGIQNKNIYDALLDYSVKSIYSNTRRKYDILYHVSGVSGYNRKEILKYISESNDVDDLNLKVYRALSFLDSKNKVEFFSFFDNYFEIFSKLKNIIELDDIYIFVISIKFYSESDQINKGLILCNIIEERILSQNDENIELASLIIYYWHSMLCFSLHKTEESIHYANKTLGLIDKENIKKISFINEKGLQSISSTLNSIIKSLTINKPIISAKKYGRNDILKVKYLDGTIKEGKYKKLEADILAERCLIIN